jgi:hypothetical protein
MNRAVLFVLLFVPAESAADPLPRVSGADWPAVRERCKKLLGKQVLSADTERKLTALLMEDVKDSDSALDRLQDLLDPLCLAGVHINPESRVKAARGPLDSALTEGRPRIVLVKVYNEGGITPPLAVAGDELIAGKKTDGRWLEAAIGKAPLSGIKLEYIALRLTARESGKREATLKFDAGQGTQDLGFRAEVPILFRIAR